PRKRRARAPKGRRIRPLGGLSGSASSRRWPLAPGTSAGDTRWRGRDTVERLGFDPFHSDPVQGRRGPIGPNQARIRYGRGYHATTRQIDGGAVGDDANRARSVGELRARRK